MKQYQEYNTKMELKQNRIDLLKGVLRAYRKLPNELVIEVIILAYNLFYEVMKYQLKFAAKLLLLCKAE